jgi:hypothetical protein
VTQLVSMPHPAERTVARKTEPAPDHRERGGYRLPPTRHFRACRQPVRRVSTQCELARTATQRDHKIIGRAPLRLVTLLGGGSGCLGRNDAPKIRAGYSHHRNYDHLRTHFRTRQLVLGSESAW